MRGTHIQGTSRSHLRDSTAFLLCMWLLGWVWYGGCSVRSAASSSGCGGVSSEKKWGCSFSSDEGCLVLFSSPHYHILTVCSLFGALIVTLWTCYGAF